ncbi:hypothetical protein D9M68_740630 [compost metagenome]
MTLRIDRRDAVVVHREVQATGRDAAALMLQRRMPDAEPGGLRGARLQLAQHLALMGRGAAEVGVGAAQAGHPGRHGRLALRQHPPGRRQADGGGQAEAVTALEKGAAIEQAVTGDEAQS